MKEEACAAAIERGYAGPYLRYINILPEEKLWLGSVLLLVRGDRVQAPAHDSAQGQDAGDAASIRLWEVGQEGKEIGQSQALLLTEVEGWQAWRFSISLPVGAEQRPVTYAVRVGGVQTQPSVFWVPGNDLPMHWGYTSCNGLSAVCRLGNAPGREKGGCAWWTWLGPGPKPGTRVEVCKCAEWTGFNPPCVMERGPCLHVLGGLGQRRRCTESGV